MEVFLRGDRVSVARVPAEVLGDENEHCDGIFTSHKGTIRVRDDSHGPGFWRTLFHEVFHFHLAWGGLSSREKDSEGSTLEEGVCDCGGATLYEFIRDNRHICEKIWAEQE